MDVNLSKGWMQALQVELEKPYFKQMMERLEDLYENGLHEIFPARDEIFKALQYCDVHDIKVVILGQDPYPTKGFAHGLSFSVKETVKKKPGSLKNIFKEIENDLGIRAPENGNLDRWAKQGVLLLNTILTVEEGRPGSHAAYGWDQFTDKIIGVLNERLTHVVYILWGSHAQQKSKIIDESHNLIIQSVHPSPLSAYRGFFGSKPFSQTNLYLEKHGKLPIYW